MGIKAADVSSAKKPARILSEPNPEGDRSPLRLGTAQDMRGAASSSGKATKKVAGPMRHNTAKDFRVAGKKGGQKGGKKTEKTRGVS